MGERTGLDYLAVFAVIDRMTPTPDDPDDLFEDIRHLEAGALDAMSRRGS